MIARLIAGVCALGLALAAPLHATIPSEPEDIVRSALEAHGGELFLDPQTLQLEGTAVFYDRDTGEIRSIAEDYRMWREFERGRKVAHGADGKVRIVAKGEGRVLFEVGYDGETTWTHDGIMPKAQADAYWATNFGFGIIRSALDEGFKLTFLPPRMIGGHGTSLVRITDPAGQETIFGFDAESGFIRYMAFDSPRGFHERIYALGACGGRDGQDRGGGSFERRRQDHWLFAHHQGRGRGRSASNFRG